MEVTVHQGKTLWEEMNQLHIDVERPCNGRGTCGSCQVYVEGIGLVKSCQFQTPGTYQVQLQRKEEFTAVDLETDGLPENTTEAVCFLDLGTTTVAGYFLYQNHRHRIAFTNPQRQYGADVTSRIQYDCQMGDGKLTQLIWQSIFERCDRYLKEYCLSECQIWVSGNTTMQHLLEGLSCKGLAAAPFIPENISAHVFTRKSPLGANYYVHMNQGISAYVGADLVSAIEAVGMNQSDEISFLLDLGTNGEMALGNRDKIYVTSTAAGPAFEASELARQQHASGLLKGLHKMKDEKIMDSFGTLCEPYFTRGYRGFTQELIRQLQMAKAAIRAGEEILLQEYGLQESEVTKVYLAGGMGYFLDPQDAAAVGLIPPQWENKTRAVGNAALLGCVKAYEKKICDLPMDTKEILLANHPRFEKIYIERMNF